MHKTEYTFKIANEIVHVGAIVNYFDNERISITVATKQDALLLAYYYTGCRVVIDERPNIAAWGLTVYKE